MLPSDKWNLHDAILRELRVRVWNIWLRKHVGCEADTMSGYLGGWLLAAVIGFRFAVVVSATDDADNINFWFSFYILHTCGSSLMK